MYHRMSFSGAQIWDRVAVENRGPWLLEYAAAAGETEWVLMSSPCPFALFDRYLERGTGSKTPD